MDHEAIERPAGKGRAGPAIAPKTIVVDHGKIYISEHLTSTRTDPIDGEAITRSSDAASCTRFGT
ncbi:hypothetical protein [Mycobacterium sp. URHB0021]